MALVFSLLFNDFDTAMMQRALQLAASVGNSTSPNPKVGCVLTRGQQIVGEGFHIMAGTPHAEIHAINQAGILAQGATAYVTLEPCSHIGKTPPCADALIQAGVAKVICAMQDPNPQVAGKGLAKLRAAGIEVASGLLAESAATLNRGFLSRIQRQRPFVTLKLAASLDGKTAFKNGQSQWITGDLARQDVQNHRALSNAIITGSGTVIADNPQLTVRNQTLLKPPVRVVLDRALRSPVNAQIFDVSHTETFLFTQSENDTSAYAKRGVQCFAWPDAHTEKNLNEVLAVLAQQGINEAWIEAGAGLSSAFLKQNCVDELIVYQAPKILGTDTVELVNYTAHESVLAEESPWQTLDVSTLGHDIKWHLRNRLLINGNGTLVL